MTINYCDNMGDNAIAPTDPNQCEEDEQDDIVADEVTLSSEEYVMLDSKLDDLNSALDFIEQKNNEIQKQLQDLLHSNREIRQELQKGNTENTPQGEGSAEKPQ